MIRLLPPDRFACHVALPAASPMAAEFAAAGAHLHVMPMERISTSHGAAAWLRYAALWPVTVARLWWLARRLHADVVHTNSLHSWYGWAVARLARRPHVWHAREIVAQSSSALRLERWLARHFATRVIAISHAVAEQLDPANVDVVFDDVDREEFSPAHAGRFRRQIKVADDVPLLGFVGRIDSWKGVDVVLDAVPLVRAHLPELQLVVAGGTVLGKEDYAAELQARAEHLGGVHWLGPRADIPELMADLDAFVAPSTLPEPFGLVLVEALASGVPVVATSIGGAPEIVARSGGLGLTVAPGDPRQLADAIVELLSWPMARARPRQLRRPLWDAVPPDFAGIYDTLLRTGGR